MRKLIELIKRYKDRKYNDGTYLVYSMGKVGSSSVESSLKSRLPFAVVFHTHFLSDNWLNEILPKQNPFFHGNIKIGKKIREYLNENKEKKIRIITLVREPVSREMSGIFENWKAHYPDIEMVESNEIIRRMNASDYSFCLNWFDTEFKEFTGIDIYAVPFDQTRGYQVYRKGNIEILCIQLEKLKDVFVQAMNEFIGIKIKLINSNIGDDKSGSVLYKEMKSIYKLPIEKADMIYGSKFMKYFYSEKDIQKFKTRWLLTENKFL